MQEKEINSFDLVMFRPDPPVDIDYINATYIFDFVTTRVVNSPKSIRDFNEKLHSLYFSEYMTNSTVTSSLKDIENFLAQYGQIVLKPLNKEPFDLASLLILDFAFVFFIFLLTKISTHLKLYNNHICIFNNIF